MRRGQSAEPVRPGRTCRSRPRATDGPQQGILPRPCPTAAITLTSTATSPQRDHGGVRLAQAVAAGERRGAPALSSLGPRRPPSERWTSAGYPIIVFYSTSQATDARSGRSALSCPRTVSRSLSGRYARADHGPAEDPCMARCRRRRSRLRSSTRTRSAVRVITRSSTHVGHVASRISSSSVAMCSLPG